MSDNRSRRSFLRRSAATVTAVTGLAAPVTAETHAESDTSGGNDESAPSDAPYYEIEQAIHAEVNRRRESRGLAALAYNANVAAAARNYSRAMAEGDFFSHTGPGEDSFADHYRDDGVDCSSLGENILYRTRTGESPEDVAANVVDQWMGSAGHRENILGDWQSEGLGVAVTDDDVVYVTQGFASCPGTTDAGDSSGEGGDADAGSDDGSTDGGDGSDGTTDSGSGDSDGGSSEPDTGGDDGSTDGSEDADSGSNDGDRDDSGDRDRDYAHRDDHRSGDRDGDWDGHWHDDERDDEYWRDDEWDRDVYVEVEEYEKSAENWCVGRHDEY